MPSPAPPSNTARSRVKGRSRKPFLQRYWWAVLLAISGVAVAVWLIEKPPGGKRARPLVGYETQAAALDREFSRFEGKALADPGIHAQFEQAAKLALTGQYTAALLLLDAVAKKAPVPVVFNDMGVLYAQVGDRARAVISFREALARDFSYTPVRRNLERLKGFTSNAADPVSAEIEPNNSNELANVIAIGKPVEAEISQLDNDVDVFRVTSPPAPRDLLAVHLENHSKTLAPRFTIYDENGVIVPWGKDQEQPGGSPTEFLAPKPNATFFLHVHGQGSTAGAYTLSVTALKAYDSYEPNDDIYSATKIRLAQEIDANIMDQDDTDFYSFVSPRTGTMTIDIGSRSTTLIPALSTFTPDMRSSGFGPDVREPGAALHHTIPVQEGSTYYIQVWSQGKSSGDYSLKVE